MFEKYILLNDKKIVFGQNNSGIWYCKELPADTLDEMDVLINKANVILNKYNIKEKNNKVKDVEIKHKP